MNAGGLLQDVRKLPWLALARWAVIALALFVLVVTIIGLLRFPDYAARHLEEYTPNDAWTGAQAQAAAAQLGWAPLTQAWLLLARDLLGMAIGYTFAAILLSRKSLNWFTLFVSLVFILMAPVSGNAARPAVEIFPFFQTYESVVGAFSWQLFFILFFFFPNGKPVPRWTGWLALVWVLSMPFTLEEQSIGFSIINTLAIGLVAIALLSQIYRYFWRSDAVQRQQTKWLVVVMVISLVIVLVVVPGGFIPPSGENLAAQLLTAYGNLLTFTLIFWLVPLAITIAILRYRLWDIDLIIRRTLVYALLSLLLGSVYFGSVVLIQRFLGDRTGQNSPAAIVFSTLLIAALFNPLRTRLQQAIDRRFFRRKYDAGQTMETLTVYLRSEVNLEEIEQRLLDTVENAMQPERVALWMRSPGNRP